MAWVIFCDVSDRSDSYLSSALYYERQMTHVKRSIRAIASELFLTPRWDIRPVPERHLSVSSQKQDGLPHLLLG